MWYLYVPGSKQAFWSAMLMLTLGWDLFAFGDINTVISNGRPSLSAVRCVVPPLAVSHQPSPSRGTCAMLANTGSRILANFIICVHVRLLVYEEFYGLL
jgi:hypothetical protein